MQRFFTFLTYLIFSCFPLYGGSLSVVIDNDFLYYSDGAYTGGLQINWLSDEQEEPDASDFSRRYIEHYHALLEPLSLPGIDRDRRNASISLHQAVITPEEGNASTPNDQRLPHAAALDLTFSYYAWDAEAFDEYRFVVGTIGPRAGGKFSQELVHALTSNHTPWGWDTQLGNSLFAGIGYMHGHKLFQRPVGETARFELFGSYNVDIGNHYAGANGSVNIRIGANIPNTFQSIGTLLGTSDNRQLHFLPHGSENGWSLHAGLCLNLISYMKIIEKAKDLGYAIDDTPLFPTGNIGADYYFDRWQISFDLFHSRLFTGKFSSGSWNRLTLTYDF